MCVLAPSWAVGRANRVIARPGTAGLQHFKASALGPKRKGPSRECAETRFLAAPRQPTKTRQRWSAKNVAP